jgi:uncharacterized protein YdeI (YjbR/CyaY-like superfamily)
VKDDEPVVRFGSQKEWERWLQKNHAKVPAVWLEFAKKGASFTTVTYAEAVESALCYGWIDGMGRSGGPEIARQRFTPRTKRSNWSRINREHAIRLTSEGRMRPSGLAAIDVAKANGRWDAAYEPPSTSKVPDDLTNALRKSAKARKFFESLDSRNRYAILHRIQDAKKPETRARRIEKFVDMLSKGEKLYP